MKITIILRGRNQVLQNRISCTLCIGKLQEKIIKYNNKMFLPYTIMIYDKIKVIYKIE